MPKAWIFEGTGREQPGSSRIRQNFEENKASQLTSAGIVAPSPVSDDGFAVPARTLVSSPLQLGNSDPFHSYAIPIGPAESFILNQYLESVSLQFNQTDPKTCLISAFSRRYYVQCLQSEAAAYGLLARNATVMGQTCLNQYAPDSLSIIRYLARGQAALQRQLALINGDETPEMVYAVMWAASFLATIELTLGRSNVHIHVHAVCALVERYVDLLAEKLDPMNVLYPIYVTFGIVSMTLTRPVFDMESWFPRTFRASWLKVETTYTDKFSSMTGSLIHSDIQDSLLQDFIISQRNNWEIYSYFLGVPLKDARPDDETDLTNGIGSHEAWYYGRTLNLAISAMNSLEGSDLCPEQMQGKATTAYVSIAMLLWVNTKNNGIASRRAFGVVCLGLLQHLKSAIIKATALQRPGQYATAKLWALFMGAHTESQRRLVLNLDCACGTWFFDAFREQVNHMQVQSWQHAVSIFEEVLYNNAMRPHISDWWDQVSPSPIRTLTVSNESFGL